MATNVTNNVAVNIDVNTEDSVKEFKSLRGELKAIEAEMQQLALAGKQNSERFQELQKRGGQLRDTMGDVRQRINALASDTSKLDSFTDGVKGIAAGFSIAEGASALFGDQNEDLQKQILKVQGAIALLNGVQEVANVLNKDSAFMVGLNTTAQTVYAAVVGTSTGAMKAFRIALISTGIGALVIGLVALIANFGAVKDAVLNVLPGLKAVGDFIGVLIDKFTDFIGVTTESSRALDKMAKDAEKTLEKNKRWMELNGDLLNKYQKQRVEAELEYKEAIKKINEDESLSTAQKYKLIEEYAKKKDRLIKASHAEEKADADKAAAELKAKEQAEYEARLKARREYLEKRRKADLEAYANEADRREGALLSERLADLEAQNVGIELQEEEIKQLNDVEAAKAAIKESQRQADLLKNKEYVDAQLRQIDFMYQFGEITQEEYTKRYTELSQARQQIDAAEMAAQRAMFAETADVLGKASKLFGEQTKAGKAFAIAQALMNTYIGITDALRAQSALPSPFDVAAKAINVAAVAKTGFDAVKNIVKVNVPGGGGSAGNTSFTPTTPSSAGQTTMSEQMKLSAQPNFQQPIKAVLVDKEFKAQSSEYNRLELASTF